MPAFATSIDVANSAANVIGADPISGTTFTGSKFAKLAGVEYEKQRLYLLRRYPWTMAMRRAVLRPIDVTTQVWTPPTYSASTTYGLGYIVIDSNSDWWQSKVASNVGNTPAAGSFWQRYFGPDSFDPFSAPADTTVAPPAAPVLSSSASGSLGAATYYVQITYTTASGETLPSVEVKLAVAANHVLTIASPAAATGATSWNAYVTTVQGQETLQSAAIAIATGYTEPTTGLVIGQFPPSSNTTSYHPGELTLKGTTVYLSTIEGNTDAPPTQNWIAQGGTYKALQILYPIGTGPPTQSTTQNVFRIPHGFLRKAPPDPKGDVGMIVGSPTGPQRNDWIFENGYIVSWRSDPIMIRFVADVIEVPAFDAEFCEALAGLIALKTATVVPGGGERTKDAQAHFARAIADARAMNGIETGAVASPIDSWITARM
jgi:hypothetical protein